MDEYDKKFAEMQKYIPFLEAMIERLQNVKDKSREVQLQKMQSLHGILSNSKRKLRIETLQRCEDVLQKLHNRVEKGNAPGLQLPIKQNENAFSQFSTSSESAKSEESKRTEQSLQSTGTEENKLEETPASPDPSISPDSGCQILPIIIPTERSAHFSGNKSNNRHTLSSEIPVITLTDGIEDTTVSSSDTASSDDVVFTEWNMLEERESERHNAKDRSNSWQALVSSDHDVATAAKLVSNNLPQKNSESRNYSLSSRDIPTVPVPSLGGSRRLSSMLEKNKLHLDMMTANSSRSESPVNVPDVRLKSPDLEILFAKPKVTSPRTKDNHNVTKPPTLLVSPPPISTEPPLSMEDLAELLSEEGDAEKRNEKASENDTRHKKNSGKSETNHTKNGKPETSHAKDGKPEINHMKDGKTSRNLLQTDSENEKQWEEVNRHIVKFPTKKGPNATEITKSDEIKGPPFQNSNDPRSQISSSGSKFELRYADNYERHPRQRDTYEISKDRQGSTARGVTEEEAPSQISVFHGTMSGRIDERNIPLYQRRPSVLSEVRMDTGPSRSENEGIDYYNMHTNQVHWPRMQSPAADHQFGNAQWPPINVYSGMAQPPLQSAQHLYQHPMNMFAGSVDPHPEPQVRQNQYPPAGPRPLLNPIARPQDMNHIVRPESMREDIPPLMSSTNFSIGPSYRGFQMGQSSYDPSFDRSSEYPHVRSTWDNPVNRTSETVYSGENIISCGIVEGPTGTSYPRTGTPCPWARDRGRGRGRDGYYDRSRMEVRSGFNRDVRRSDWENSNRFGRDNRNVCERDPRIRVEHNATVLNQAKDHGATNQTKLNSGSVRDPRLSKDKHISPTKAKDNAAATTITHNERDPRKRPPVPPVTQKKKTNKEKSRSQKSSEKRIDLENYKEKADKPSKSDRMQSPLESLYGVIDTKSSHGSGLQNFRIPKIKRPEKSLEHPPPLLSQLSPSSTTNHIANERKKDVLFKSPRAKNKAVKKSGSTYIENSSKDVAIAEVSSSSNVNDATENLNAHATVDVVQDDVTREEEILSTSHIDETSKSETKIDDLDSMKSSDIMEKSQKDELNTDNMKPKEEVAQKWRPMIEALIRKSFESGEGKKLVEHAKLMRKLGEVLQAKKFKRIKKIIDSESESSSSDKDGTVESIKKTQTRKRRVIVSDSSDDECLAERLGILNTNSNVNDEGIASATSFDAESFERSLKEKVKRIASDNLNNELSKNIKCYAKKDDLLKNIEKSDNSKVAQSNTRLENSYEEQNKTEKMNIQLESDKQINSQLKDSNKEKEGKEDNIDRTHEDESKSTNGSLQPSDQAKDQASCIELVTADMVDDKSNENDKPKAKTKRRNSLEMLQEDIREMFISDDVVSATGHRMCRLSKESQNIPGSIGAISRTSTPINLKKDDTSNASEKKSSALITERSLKITDESSNTKSKKGSKSNKSKVKGKKDNQRITRNLRSKEPVPSSDSEEDQPLSLRTEWLLNNNADNSTPNRDEDRNEESNDTLRRSKRNIQRKNFTKEPRVLVEKTDFTKMDTSKVMFDSSSDESFSIDVSELAAVVDISLRPDGQSDQELVDTIANSKTRRKAVTNANKQISKSKRNASLLTDEKSEDGISITDEESLMSDILMSDISMSSSTTGKKRSGGAARTCAREELLSNILVGLVPTTNKCSLLTNKGDEADVDDEANVLLSETNAKKSTTKKKKKKSNWQMGILQKKKRKKNISSLKTDQERQEMNIEAIVETNIATNAVETDPLISQDNNVTATEKTSEETTNEQPVDDISINSIVKCDAVDEQHPNISDINTADTKLSNQLVSLKISNALEEISPNDSFLSIEENKPSLDIETEEIKIMESIITESLSTIVYDERMEKIFEIMNTEQLIKYAWTGQDKYKCQLCFFTGKNIVHHYKMNHPEREVMIARLKLADATAAILEAESVDTTETATHSIEIATGQVCRYHCRFCCFITEGAADVALEAFYEHCTTHTGEYRFHCKSCPYQAVAKASMRTHYYKVCRKLNDTFNESALEDDVPKENGVVYGYLCRDCNYVQLKRHNVELHVIFWHRDKTTEILKINMSAAILENVVSDDKNLQESADIQQSQSQLQSQQQQQQLVVEEIKPEITKLEDTEDTEHKDVPTEMKIELILQANDVVDMTKLQDETVSDTGEKCNVPHESEAERDIDIEMKEEIDEGTKTSQNELEGSVSTTGNLSVFVCPPELENKEVEIQLERKKLMQEIANNIGINRNKNISKSGQSIIDMLQNKMRTDVTVNIEHELASNEGDEVKEGLALLLVDTAAELLRVEQTIKEDPLNQLEKSEITQDTESAEQLVSDSTEITNDADKAELKIRDPLAILDPNKNSESDGEASDNDTVRHSAVYESESSSEQSDTEPTDVNMILKETSSINVSSSSSRDPMLTTIQRLAAQLQSAKPLDVPAADDVKIKSEPIITIQKSPNVIPITCSKRLITQSDVDRCKITPKLRKNANPPKNFLRFRRLSGDMLSMPTSLLENQEDTRASSTDGTQSDNTLDILQMDTEEECSFLKIENVVSLAPTSDNNETESPIVNDIRKAVEISPIKSKHRSLLKKPSQALILKKVNVIAQPLMNTDLQTIQPATSDKMTFIPIRSLPISAKHTTAAATHRTSNYMSKTVSTYSKPKIISLENNKIVFPLSNSPIANPTNTGTTVPGTSNSTNVNYKILKVMRTPAIIKPKILPSIVPSNMIKKSTDAFSSMMEAESLAHLFKCTGYNCYFTTDSLILFYQHYSQHSQEVVKLNCMPPYDFQKCVYCYEPLTNMNTIREHMLEKHGHCRYQCGYCFYRAVVPSYVREHQATHHSDNKFYMLEGKMSKRILEEAINRHDYVHPFVCNNGSAYNDCSKFFYVPETFAMHLSTKHLSSRSIFKCHLCSAKFSTIDALVFHYKSHGFSKYQCLYCLHGTDNPIELHQHLSVFHYNHLPNILERTLPLKVTRSKSVIDQLIIRTFDEFGKLVSKIHELNAVGSKNNANDTSIQVSTNALNILTYPEQSSVEMALNQERMPNLLGQTSEGLNNMKASIFNIASKLSKDASHTNTNENVSSSTDTSIISDSQKQSPYENPSSSKLNESKSLSQLEKIKLSDCTIKQILQEPELELLSCMNNSNATDPLEFSDEFNCSDEFVNTNLLDNPDILKSLTANSGNALFFKDEPISEDKIEDSDIEILENTENTKINKSKNVENDQMNQTTEQNSSEQNTEKKQSTPSIDTENKCTSKESNDASATLRPDEPLTLEDIKHTGCMGYDLYKCCYEGCNFAAMTSALLRPHIKKCSRHTNNKNLYCAHCKKRFVKIGFLLEHLKAHGLKRFGCSLCKMRYAVSYQATAHMKMKHKYPHTKLVPADPTNPSVDGLFIVQATRFKNVERKTRKRRRPKPAEQESEKAMDNEKLQFSPDEIDQLPRQAIYLREVQCAVCPYTTKVRTNIIRHLQLHAKDETVPEIGPVNPVPCLDKKERMFDKMVNLASSSHQNGRMGGKPKQSVEDNDEEAIPKFVPEHKRYVCSVAECNYLTVDEAMLRYHLKALHSEEPYFRCPHCPQQSTGQESQNIGIDKMGVHLKMHDTRLYKCSHCNHHHYHRHVVERHLTDKHPEKRPFVKVIRELDNTENIQQPLQEEVEDEVPDPDGNHWKCNLCDFKCAYKAEMGSHAAAVHDEKCQYKCALCSFKTSGKILFEQHIGSKHTYDTNVDFVLVYQRIKGVNKRNTEVTEQGSNQDEPFDTTPLWRRDMPRVRHIRGILLEEEEDKVSATEISAAKPSLGKRKNEIELVTKPAKVKISKSSSFDENKTSKEKSKKSLFYEKLEEMEDENTKESMNKSDSHSINDKSTSEDPKAKMTELDDVNDSDVGRFGPYGKPDGNMYTCTLCNRFRTKYKHDMRDHLYRELNYARWHCKSCGYMSVNRNSLMQHFAKHHQGERPNHEPLSPDNAIEEWVITLLKKQTDMIKAMSQQLNAVFKSTITAFNTSTSNPEINPITAKTIHTDKKIVDLAPAITTLQNDILRDANRGIDTDDGDSRDNEDLVIDMKEDSILEDGNNENMPENDKSFEKDEPEKPFICKHCQMKFTHGRGFKLHVQLTHLKRLSFLCPYCDRSTNSEALMRQHVRKKHPGRAEQIIHNPAAGGPELTNEFWEKEYGLICKRKVRKYKRKLNVDMDSSDGNKGDSSKDDGSKSDDSKGDSSKVADNVAGNRTDMQEKCKTCGFTAINHIGLKSHMRTHVPKCNIRCSHCTFSCTMKAELLEHWEINHPTIPFKMQSVTTAEASSPKKRNIDVRKDDAKETHTMPVVTYSCYYCNLRSHSLYSLKRHWSYMHKTAKGAEDSNAADSGPFRYKEQLPLPRLSAQNRVRRENTEAFHDSVKRLGESSSESVASSSDIQYQGWVCQWCKEFCETDSDTRIHQDMYHSHLQFNFKMQKKCEQQQQHEEELHWQRKGYVCKACSYATVSIASIRRHVIKHVDLFECKYCDQTFSTPVGISAHSAEKHMGLATKIESISNFDTVMEKLISQIKWSKAVASSSEVKSEKLEQGRVSDASAPHHAVARKSTTKSIVSHMKPGIRAFKAVARKSTNPLSRHLRESVNYDIGQRIIKTEINEETESKSSFSYYGISSAPVNLAKLSTYMVVGGHSMKVNCTTLAQLININPQVILKDIKHDSKNAAILSKND